MMRDIATTAAGVAGGHLAANAIMGMVSGGKSEEAAPAPQGLYVRAHYSNVSADKEYLTIIK
jgi:hypothetical protein